MDNKFLVGKKIREIRKKNDLTQEQFSEKIDIEPASLSNIENGKSFPSMQTALNIMDKFNILPQDFFDNSYYKEENEIDEEIFKILKNLPIKEKRIIYRIIKNFDI